jgi:hypothetical protein
MGSRSSVRLPSVAECREELRVVLSSRVFRQAENLSRLLEYICEKALAGESESVTEYTIAVDVFGKPRAFRDSRDSSVRVDVHRLRKRLALFYTREGASHTLRIVIPPGSYVPDFQVCQTPPTVQAPSEEAQQGEPNVVSSTIINGNGSSIVLPAEANTDTESSILPDVPPAVGKPGRSRFIVAALAVALVIVAAAIWAVRERIRVAPQAIVSMTKFPPAPVTNKEVHILAGFAGKEWEDAAGRVWQPDRYFSGGVSRPGPQELRSAPPDRRLFQTMREAVADDPLAERPAFTYDIPLQPGSYELRLYFADPLMSSPPSQEGEDNQNSRRFVVNANGHALLQEFDAVSDANYGDVDVRAFKDVVPASDGKVHLEFTPQPHRPFVNAIELVPSRPGHSNPIRITARRSSYADPSGKIWGPDNYFIRGRLVRHAMPEASDFPELFRSERYGNFSYAIPVPPGSYTLTLYFAETIFGPLAPSLFCRGPKCRVFDVSCNGSPLLRDFDIYEAAGGAFRPVIRKFSGLRPNGQGKLLVSFSSSVNYAEVRALEVVDEAP